jgi:hypothetical protein
MAEGAGASELLEGRGETKGRTDGKWGEGGGTLNFS